MFKDFNTYFKSIIMKKSILNLGKALNKAEQKQIKGGIIGSCASLCGTASRGTKCFASSGLAACDGSGGYIYY